jgi:outer membrane usher protein
MQRFCNLLNKILFIILLFNLSVSILANPLDTSATVDQLNELLVSVTLNHKDTQDTVILLQAPNGHLFIAKTKLDQWGITHFPSDIPTIQNENETYMQLDSPGINYSVNQQKMALELNVPEKYFNPNVFNLKPGFIVPTSPPPGASLSYDLFTQDSNFYYQHSGLFNVAAFNRFGSLTSGFLTQLTNQSTLSQQSNFLRLNTTFQRDNPQTMTSFMLGDSFTTPGSWGQSVSFGGIQWSTDFDTQPQFITFPLPTARGVATVPSSVDLFVNNALIDQNHVPAGPFALTNIPVVTGRGDMQVITTDLLGRQQITTLPYYVSNTLLQPGLNDFSYQLGFIRNNLGINSNDYGQLALVATQRHGFNNHLTAEAHVELLNKQQTLGASVNYLLSNLGIINLSIAGSQSNLSNANGSQGTGGLIDCGFQHQSLRGLSYGADAEFTTANFMQMGIQEGQFAPSFQGRFNIGKSLFNHSTLGLSYIEQLNRNSEHAGIISLNYNQSFLQRWNLNISAFNNLLGSHSNSVLLSVNRNIGQRTSASMGATFQDQTNQGNIQLTQNLPLGPGYGYNLYAGAGENPNYTANLSAQNRIGSYAIGAARQQNQEGVNATMSGGMVWLDRHLYLTRDVGKSFAVVQLPGYADVAVYNENQFMGRTDLHGNVLIPNILPYYENQIRIDPNDLPMSAQVDTIQLNAIPYINSGVIVKFNNISNHAGTFHLFSKNGKAIPAGTKVKFSGGSEEFFVGMDGEVYMTGFNNGSNTIEADRDGQSCIFNIFYSENTQEALPDLGSRICGDL